MVFVRKIVRKSIERNNHVINIPKEVVEEYDWIGATVKISKKKKGVFISAITDEPDDADVKIKSDIREEKDSKYTSIH